VSGEGGALGRIDDGEGKRMGREFKLKKRFHGDEGDWKRKGIRGG